MPGLSGIRQQLGAVTVRALAACGYSLRRTAELTHLADIHGSDKGFRKAAHAYTRVYDQLFSPLRREPIVLLELGLGNRSAPSLRMWRSYFSQARIFGFDMEDFSHIRLDRCVIVRGDVASAADVERLVGAIGGPIDVIIDDASHASHHQQAALGALFAHLRTGGLYIIEDLHWQPEGIEIAGSSKTRELLRRFQHDGSFASPVIPAAQRAYLEANIANLALYDSMTSTRLDALDALAVLTKA